MKHANKMLTAIVLVLVLPLLYAGAYLAMLGAPEAHFVGGVDHRAGKLVFEPEYRFGGKNVAALFYPAHAVDRFLRPEDWEWEGSFSR